MKAIHFHLFSIESVFTYRNIKKTLTFEESFISKCTKERRKKCVRNIELVDERRELELFSLDASEERAMQASSDILQLYALSFTTRRRAR